LILEKDEPSEENKNTENNEPTEENNETEAGKSDEGTPNPTIRKVELCENIEPWCDVAFPDCKEEKPRKLCRKYCGLCSGTLLSIILLVNWDITCKYLYMHVNHIFYKYITHIIDIGLEVTTEEIPLIITESPITKGNQIL